MQSIYDSKNLIRARIFKSLKSTEKTILIIPGGPGLSSDYLKGVSRSLGKKCPYNIMLIDLPNHFKENKKLKIKYKEHSKKIISFLKWIEKEKKLKVDSVIAHSFGCHVAIDILRKNKAIRHAHLVAFPRSENIRNGIKKWIARFNLPINNEKNFSIFWKKIIDYYFFNKIFYKKYLTKNTSWITNKEQMSGRTFALDDLSRIKSLDFKLFFHDGARDPLYTKKDYKKLKDNLSGSKFYFYKKSAHFCLLEEEKLFVKRVRISENL